MSEYIRCTSVRYGKKISKTMRERVLRLRRKGYTIRRICEETKLCSSTAQRICSAAGLRRQTMKCYTKEQLDTITRLYPTTSITKLTEMTGLACGSINYIVGKLGLQRVEGYAEQRRKEKSQRMARLRAEHPEYNKRAIRTRLIRRRLDERRLLAGMPQKTKERFCMSRRYLDCRGKLIRLNGYIKEPDDKMVLLYDEKTKRRLPDTAPVYGGELRDEAYFTRRWGVEFRRAQ